MSATRSEGCWGFSITYLNFVFTFANLWKATLCGAIFPDDQAFRDFLVEEVGEDIWNRIYIGERMAFLDSVREMTLWRVYRPGRKVVSQPESHERLMTSGLPQVRR